MKVLWITDMILKSNNTIHLKHFVYTLSEYQSFDLGIKNEKFVIGRSRPLIPANISQFL